MAKIEIKPFIDAARVGMDTKIDKDDISNEFVQQSGLTFYYGSKHAQACRQSQIAKSNLELVTARLDYKIRNEASANNLKFTEGGILAQIKMQAAYQEALASHIDAEYVEALIKSANSAMAHKRDMLIQIGADNREEMKGRLSSKGSLSDQAMNLIGSSAK